MARKKKMTPKTISRIWAVWAIVLGTLWAVYGLTGADPMFRIVLVVISALCPIVMILLVRPHDKPRKS